MVERLHSGPGARRAVVNGRPPLSPRTPRPRVNCVTCAMRVTCLTRVIPRPETSRPMSESQYESPDVPDSYDDLLAKLLVHSWMVATGRTLRADVPPRKLSAAELIDFWADDFGCEPDPVCHAASRASRRGRHAKRPREYRDSA